jgi:2-polyprenyl-3-methyl-5-hydroxy-6-metoxy-1,4-benzoquinol methylase
MTTPQTSSSLQEQAGRVMEQLYGFVNVYLLNTGLELGLFAQLREAGPHGLTPAELAERGGLHEPYLAVWCQSAYGYGYLEVTAENRFCLAPHMDMLLADPHSPAYMGNILQLFATYCGKDLLQHPHYLQSGEVFTFQEHGEGFSGIIAKNGLTKGAKFLKMVVPQVPGLEAKLREGATLLDVGCSGGTFMMALARAYPACRFVGVDIDRHALPLAEAEIKRAGLTERISVQAMGAEAIDFDSVFDVITLNSVIHEVRPPLKPQAVARCLHALKPGGLLLITDFSLPDSLLGLREPAYRMVLMDQFLEMSWGNRHQTKREQLDLLTQAGFVNVHHGPLGDNLYVLLRGEKPQN